jgi:Legionella pneumophila major outer membrane protein precursor
MKRALFLALCALTQLSALGNCGDFEFTVDYLYWKPANFAIDFGEVERQSNEKFIFTRQLIDPTYHSGVRGEAWWRCCPLSFIGRYSWIESRQRQSFVGYRDVGVEVIYHAAELHSSYQLCSPLSVLLGGRILYTALNTLAITQTNPISIDRGHSRFAGGGASVGISGGWNLLSCLELFAEGHFALLYGSSMETSTGRQSNTVVFAPQSFQVWTREIDGCIGVRYDICWGCVALGLKLGWEVRAYLDFPNWQPKEGTFPIPLQQHGKSIGGPFLGLSAGF